jgi:hypothetical protein
MPSKLFFFTQNLTVHQLRSRDEIDPGSRRVVK